MCWPAQQRVGMRAQHLYVDISYRVIACIGTAYMTMADVVMAYVIQGLK